MIEARGLVKYYGERCAVAGVDLDIEPNQVVGLLGLNGTGKTTLLRMLAGDLEPSAGTVRIDGHDLIEHPLAYRRRVGFLPEGVPLYPDMTTRELIAWCGVVRGMKRGAALERAATLSERLAFADYLDEPVRNLSQGYRKRVGVAATVVHDPALVILDEPVSGLDPVQVVEMRELIRALAHEHTVVLSSHILAEISQTCDLIFVIHQGRIAARGTEKDILDAIEGTAAVEVEFAGDAALAQRVARAVEGVDGVDVSASASGHHRLVVRARGEVRPALVRALVEQARADILRVGRIEGDLESVFVRLAAGKSIDREAA